MRLLSARRARLTLLLREHSTDFPGCTTIIINPWTPEALFKELANHKFDHIYNLAAYGVSPGRRDPAEMIRINVDFARSLVDLAAMTGARTFVHIGSFSEYAPGPRHPIAESATLESHKLYGTSKAAGALLAHMTATNLKLPFVAVRLFSVYGLGEAPHRLLPSLVSRLKKGERVPLSAGEQVRDFLHVEDAASGLVALSESLAEHKGQHIVNLCSGTGVPVRRFCELVASRLGASSSLLGFGDIDYRPDDMMHTVGDTALLHAFTRWRPRFDLEKGIAAAIVCEPAKEDTQ